MKAFYQLQNLRSSWFQDFRVDKCFEIPWNHFPQALNMIAVCKLHQPRRIVLWVSQRLFAKKYVNCKLKLHSKGFYEQILGGVTVLKFFQTFALDLSRVWNVPYNPRPPISGPPIPSPPISSPPFQAPYHIRPPHIRPPFPYQTPHPRPTILSPDDQYEAPC